MKRSQTVRLRCVAVGTGLMVMGVVLTGQIVNGCPLLRIGLKSMLMELFVKALDVQQVVGLREVLLGSRVAGFNQILGICLPQEAEE